MKSLIDKTSKINFVSFIILLDLYHSGCTEDRRRFGNSKNKLRFFCYSARLATTLAAPKIGGASAIAKINFVSFCYSARLALSLQ
jgi:hypothetical protein